MSDNPPMSDSLNRFRLRTFGTLRLEGQAEETVLGRHGHQRRRLALLAVLASSGARGRSRDQLLLLFWPDATQARARHSLEQLLYAIRTSIDENVFTGVNPVSLRSDVVSSDVGDFMAAIERGDLERATREYRGPFLDGFYLTDAPEFEEWMTSERAQLERSYTTALEKLALHAEAANDHAKAVIWWRKLAEADRVASRGAEGLIRALMNAGDHVGALQHAEQYESIVQQQLGTSVGPAVTKLVNELRSKMGNSAASTSKMQTAPQPREQKLHPPRQVVLSDPPTETTRVTPALNRRLYLAALAILMVAGVAATLWFTRPPTGQSSTPRGTARLVAVLPFSNVSGDRQDAAFVEGLREEIITVLAKIANLRVVSPASAGAFRNSPTAVAHLADSLGVTNTLEGSVQRSGSHLRVQVRLLDAPTSTALWSETYDRDIKDIFAVQSDIAASVARELDLRIGAGRLARIRHGTTSNVAAYELYLRGSDPANTRSDSAANRGMEYFSQAIALDSTFAAAYAGFARLRLRNPYGAAGGYMKFRDRLAIADNASRKAIALDDSLGEAHAMRGLIAARSTYDLQTAESELRKAMALDPGNAKFHEYLVLIYVLAGRPEDAVVEGQRAIQLDPLSPTATAQYAYALAADKRCGDALVELQKLKSLRPPLLRAASITSGCYAEKNMWPEAIAALREVAAASGSRGQAEIGYMLARSGQTTEARQVLDSLRERYRILGEGAVEIALVHFGLGERDQTFSWLEKAQGEFSVNFDWIPWVMDQLRSDPRMEKLVPRIGVQKR